MSPTRLAVLVLSTSALAASGCGSSSTTTNGATTGTTTTSSATTSSPTTSTGSTSASSTSPKPTAHAALAAEANTICRRLHAKLKASSVTNSQKVEQLFSQAATYESAALGELRQLNPPSSWEDLITALDTLAKDSAMYAGYARANKLSEGRNLVNSYLPVKHLGVVAAKSSGLGECALAL